MQTSYWTTPPGPTIRAGGVGASRTDGADTLGERRRPSDQPTDVVASTILLPNLMEKGRLGSTEQHVDLEKDQVRATIYDEETRAKMIEMGSIPPSSPNIGFVQRLFLWRRAGPFLPVFYSGSPVGRLAEQPNIVV